jgi:hypothetical protein
MQGAVGRPVYTSDGVDLGTVVAVGDERFKVDTNLAPDLWLAFDTVRGVSERYVLLAITHNEVRQRAHALEGKQKPFISTEGTSHPGAGEV